MGPRGTLYGLGVGPGDPELLTVKAMRLLQAAPVVAFFAARNRPGVARSILEGLIPSEARQLRLEYPVTTEIPVSDPRYGEAMGRFYDEAANRVDASSRPGATWPWSAKAIPSSTALTCTCTVGWKARWRSKWCRASPACPAAGRGPAFP